MALASPDPDSNIEHYTFQVFSFVYSLLLID